VGAREIALRMVKWAREKLRCGWLSGQLDYSDSFVLAHTLARHCGSSPALTRRMDRRAKPSGDELYPSAPVITSSLPGRAERRVTRQSNPPPYPPPQAGEGAERSEASGGSLLFMPSARNADGSAPWTAGSSPAVTTCLRLRRTIPRHCRAAPKDALR